MEPRLATQRPRLPARLLGIALPVLALLAPCSQPDAADLAAEAHDLWMAVNLSPRQLTDPDLIHKVSRALAETGVPAGNLHLEITETAVMRSVDASASTLDALRQLGVHLIDGSIYFDDKAPLANVRKAITAPPATPAAGIVDSPGRI